MNSIDQKLREDAQRIEASAPESLKLHLRRSVTGNYHEDSAVRSGIFFQPQFVTGMAMGLMLLVAGLVWLNQANSPMSPTVAKTSGLAGFEDPVARMAQAMNQQVTHEAVLHDELNRLNSDWQKIRTRVRDQIDPLL